VAGLPRAGGGCGLICVCVCVWVGVGVCACVCVDVVCPVCIGMEDALCFCMGRMQCMVMECHVPKKSEVAPRVCVCEWEGPVFE